jgi:uncharacterized protein YdeI (YjbR/CyaY-like superfamily)
MGIRDARVDEYIAKAPPFARPVLNHLREAVHEVCPEVEEAMKWSRPFFLYKGMLCNMSAFKEHCSFGFWKGNQVFGSTRMESANEAMGQFGRLTSVDDLPPRKTLLGYIQKAKKLNDEGTPGPIALRERGSKPPLPVPEYFTAALAKNKKARANFEGFSASARREYIAWLTEAKTEATRERRLQTAVEWLAAGKTRNWKYENC